LTVSRMCSSSSTTRTHPTRLRAVTRKF
jgi:hypothetical protein